MTELAAITLAAAVAATAAYAQNRRPPESAPERAKPDATAAEAARQRKANAVFLLVGLADDAAKYEDTRLRARVQARVADALWTSDRDRAAALFLEAWESAETAHADQVRREADERRRAREGGGPVILNESDVRDEVLRLAAMRDRALGEQLLARLAAARTREAEQAEAAAPAASNPLAAASNAIVQRLHLAESLLAADDAKRAIELASPALGAVTVQAVDFLSDLRAADAAPPPR